MASGKQADIFQAIDNQQPENGRRKEFPQIPDILRSRFLRGKEEKGQEPGKHGTQNNHGNCDNLLDYGHRVSPPFSMGLRSKVKVPRMASMEGMINRSAPNTSRQSRESPNPR